MASRAAFSLHWSVFISEWALLVRMALDTSCIPSGSEPGLFEFESTMRIVAIAAAHGSFQHLVMEGGRKRRLDLAVATQTELRIVRFQHSNTCEARLLGVRVGHLHIRARQILSARV